MSGHAPVDRVVVMQNARIRSTFLGREDHGIPSFMIDLEMDGCGQGFGGMDLRAWPADWFAQLLDVLGVETWEKLPGTVCRIEGTSSRIDRIGHPIKDAWFYLRTMSNKAPS